MTEEALKKLEKQVNCSICLHAYTDPKLLQCHHVYCQTCLVKLVVRDQQGQLTLTCPICRQNTPIPANGVAGLQSAFHISHLLEITESLKKCKKDSSVTLEGAVGGTASDDSLCSVVKHCFEHAEEELKLYCETCGELICFKCALKGGKHHSHDYDELNKAVTKYKGEITTSLEPMEKQLTTTNKALAQLDTHCGEISDQQAAIEANIHDTTRRLHEVIDVRKTELISRLHGITQRKLKGLAAQMDQIETTQAQLSNCIHFMKESLRTGSQREVHVLLMKTTIVKQVKDLTTTFQPDMLEPNTDADMYFSFSADLTAVCQNYGQVSAPHIPDPSQCYVTGKLLEVAVVGEKSTAVLEAINFKSQPCKEPIKSIECELVSEITGTRARGSIERRGQNQYELSYQPTIKGRHQLHIRIEGQHIRGSPFKVAAKSPIEKLGTPISILGGVKEPWGVAINQRGEVVVTENAGHCISVFSPSGEKLRSFSLCDTGHRTVTAAVDGEGNILVVDNYDLSVQKYTSEGNFLTAALDSARNKLVQILDVAYNTSNKKMYAVSKNNCVEVLNSDLTFSSTFGKDGSGKGQFDNPVGVACDNTGKVYVADTDNHRIQVFTAEGKFLRMFGRRGAGRGELKRPSGIAIDTSGRVYVSEGWNHRVSVFTSNGQFVTSFGRLGKGPGKFNYPCGLAVDDSGVVYVCDSDRVQIF